MSIFENWFQPDALAKQQAKGERSNSDIKVEREIAQQHAMLQDFSLAWKGDSELVGPIPEDYSAALKAAQARPMEFKETSLGMPGHEENRRLKAALEKAAMEKAWMEAKRGY